MSFRFLNPFYSQRERFPKALLYSAAFHLALFYLLVGDPLSIFQKRRPPLETGELRVHLLSPPQTEEKAPRKENQADSILFPQEAGGALSEALEASPPEDGIGLVDSTPVSSSSASASGRKIPKNMTGPEDCLLKLVGMVCPDADLECIAEYKAFCSALPE